MKKLLILWLVFCYSQINAQTITITQVTGWYETAYIKWNPVAGVDTYNVYYTGGGFTDKLIDTKLVRSYGSYFRADVLGLAAGNYTIKVAPVTAAVEGTATVSSAVTVLAQDRNGFAHAGGRVPGGYNLNGTLKTNAVVIYVTPNSKNTVSLTVTGATTNPCVVLQAILDGFKRGQDTRPLVVRFIGNITDFNYMLNGDIVVENNNNANSSITLEGVGSDAYANGWGIRVKNASNIEINNLGFMLTDASEGDNVGLQQANDHIWVHNCDFFYGAAGGAADQVKGDGALDCKKSTYITNSYNHFWDSGKCNLLGLSENTTLDLYISYHHNWYDHSDSRHPRVRFYSAHVYNNYYDGNSKYGAGATMGSSIFMEGNYFRNCKYPMLISMQGSDIFSGTGGTFSSEDGGMIKSFNNIMSGQTRFVPYNATTFPIEFDAVESTTRNQTISSSIVTKQGATAYNNFDSNPILYINSLTVDSPTVARDNVILHSGRVGGGDLIWTFNNAVDDASSAVNVPLLNALTGYTTSIVYIQGDPIPPANPQTLAIPSNNDQLVNNGTPIVDMVFTWGGTATTATITGLPAAGISYSIDTVLHTITISGTPTSNVSFIVTTSGTSGTPVSGSGDISIIGLPPGNQIHNFTASILASTFYTFTNCNMNSTAGTASFDGLNLTARMKMESLTSITYTTPAISTLTLVFDPTFVGTAKLNGTAYTATAGIVTIPNVPIGLNTIAKGTTANLFYIKTEYSLATTQNDLKNKIGLIPNPVLNELTIDSPNAEIEKIVIYNLLGQEIINSQGNIKIINLSYLTTGTYIIKIFTSEGIVEKRVLKK